MLTSKSQNIIQYPTWGLACHTVRPLIYIGEWGPSVGLQGPSAGAIKIIHLCP